ncbi:unnamed protein product [Allacma fusca]|uniref:NSF AAA+ ATPase lid domain-containing protein n=1 Tax=Allacma fusca TaxID=39272 RepID=A0A8J2PGD0_9HEXA|nr:unnamed protein product [Allacma fusca]
MKLCSFRVFIGIKKLLALIDLLRQTEGDYRVAKFLSKLEEDDAIELRGGAVCGCLHDCWPLVGLCVGGGVGGLFGMAVGVAVGLTLGIIVGLIVGLTFGIIFGFIAGEVTNGKADTRRPKKSKQEKEDEEWLAWIMAAQAQQQPQ